MSSEQIFQGTAVIDCSCSAQALGFQVSKEETVKEQRKYTVKPPKDLRSRFEAKVEAKLVAEEEEKERERRMEEDARIAVSNDFKAWLGQSRINPFTPKFKNYILQTFLKRNV